MLVLAFDRHVMPAVGTDRAGTVIPVFGGLVITIVRPSPNAIHHIHISPFENLPASVRLPRSARHKCEDHPVKLSDATREAIAIHQAAGRRFQAGGVR